MQIGKDSVVSLNYELSDASGKVIEKTQEPVTYLHGGYDGIYQNSINEYDPVANIWTLAGKLPEAMQGGSVSYINGQLIVADGTVDNQGGWAQNQIWLDSQT